MKSCRVVLAERAQADIRNVHDYIAFELRLPESASVHTGRILDVIGRLAIFPEKHPLCQIDGLKDMGLRVVPTGRYRVFYKIVEKSNVVLIVRVLYARRDVVKAFSEES